MLEIRTPKSWARFTTIREDVEIIRSLADPSIVLAPEPGGSVHLHDLSADQDGQTGCPDRGDIGAFEDPARILHSSSVQALGNHFCSVPDLRHKLNAAMLVLSLEVLSLFRPTLSAAGSYYVYRSGPSRTILESIVDDPRVHRAHRRFFCGESVTLQLISITHVLSYSEPQSALVALTWVPSTPTTWVSRALQNHRPHPNRRVGPPI